VANTDITPCLCLNNQIRCEGKSVTDAILKTVFEKIDKSRPNYMKTFEGLELYDTTVTKIAPQIFGGIILRTFVKLNRNPITELSLGNFPDIVYLDITDNKLSNISSNTFLGLKSLRYINVGNNQIENFPKDTFSVLDNLERIDLSGNKIKKLNYDTFSSEYNNNIELSEINLSFNDLTALPDNLFWPMRRPRIVNLANNKLSEIGPNVLSFGEDVWNYEPIKIILSSNGLKDTNFNNQTFKHIEMQKLSIELNLSHNNLTHLNETIFHPLLKANPSSVIDVNDNPIKCGDCAHKWIISDEALRSKKAIKLDHCSDDTKRNIWQFTQTDFKSC